MLNLAGYITFPPELRCKQTQEKFDCVKFLEKCNSITNRDISCTRLELHNAWYGISFFDFSNHASGIEDTIECLLVFVQKFSENEVSFFMRIIDDERPSNGIWDKPYTRTWTYGS